MDNQLPIIDIYKLTFHLTAVTPVKFRFLDLRDNFRTAIRDISCPPKHRTKDNCEKCILSSTCLYYKLFETNKTSGRYHYLPKPFILEPPPIPDVRYNTVDNWSFSLVLMGDIVEYLPNLIFCFEELGRSGLVKGFGKFRIDEVRARFPYAKSPGKVIYSDGSYTFSSDLHIDFAGEVASTGNITSSRLDFITPTVISENRQLTQSPKFSTLILNLLRRIKILSELYGRKPWETGWEPYLEQAENVCNGQYQIMYWENISRNSRRRGAHQMQGFVGSITYNGKLTPFWQLLKLGSILHVGGSTAFGLGKYEIKQI